MQLGPAEKREILDEKGKGLLLTLLGAAHSLNHSLFIVLPLFLSDVATEFSTTIYTIGLIATVTGFIYGAGSLVGGSISDRLGEIKTITLSLALSGASTIIFLVAHDLAVFSLGLICVGAWASLYHPTANSIISKVFQDNMAEAMGLHGTGGNVGYMFTPLVTVAIGSFWGWRYPLLLFGLLSISVSILLLKLRRVSVERKKERIKTAEVIKTPGLLTLLIYNVLVGLYFKGVEFIFPTFLQARFPFFEKEVVATIKGIAVFVIFAAGILGQWLGGRVSDSFGSKRALIGTSTGVSLSMFLLLLLISPQPILGVSVFVLLYGFCFYGHQPALNSLAGLITPEGMRGTMFGILFFFSFGLGSASTFVTSFLAERYNLEIAFLVLVMFSVSALLLSLFAPSREKHSNNNKKECAKSP